MLQPLRCVRFGEMLLDENLRTFLLCTNCRAEYVNVQDFGAHLKASSCGGGIFKENGITLKWPTDKGVCYKSTAKSKKEYLVYNLKDVAAHTRTKTRCIAAAAPTTQDITSKADTDDGFLDLMKIEDEVLDPRWYTDDATADGAFSSEKALAYNELVEAVTPYVQFKENVKKYAGKNVKIKKTPELPLDTKCKLKTYSALKQPAMAQSKNDTQMPTKNLTNNRILNSAAKRPLSMEPQSKVPSTNNLNKVTAAATEQQTPQQQEMHITKQYVVKLVDNKITANESPLAKRRKTVTIPMEQVQIQPEFQKQFGKTCTSVPAQLPVVETPKPNVRQVTKVVQKIQQPAVQQPNKVSIAAANKPNPQLPKAIPIATSLPTKQSPMLASSSTTQPNVKQTEQILTKLKTLGLQIKRTQPAVGGNTTPQAKPIDKTLELLKKLQSKGMKVKVVNKEATTHKGTNATATSVMPRQKAAIKTTTAAVGGGQTKLTTNGKTTLNRNLIIRKVK